MLCDPGESEGSMGRGWAPWEAVRSERGENHVGEPETEQTGAKRGEAVRLAEQPAAGQNDRHAISSTLSKLGWD